ncbi:dipeptide ABC transporter ATP-binding protein [Chloroflexota bacterium]
MTVIDSGDDTILDIKNLTVAYQQAGEWLEAVRGVSLRIQGGETYGLVGESGSGKTSLVLAVMRYLGETGSIRSGEIHLGDLDLLSLDDNQLRQVWGKQITLVPQNPQSALNPSLRVGDQLIETLRHNLNLSHEEAERQAVEWLEMVRLPDPGRVAAQYPHQISGGMQQRVMIAMALCTDPQLLILDEPTTDLDVTTQAVILDLIRELTQEQNTGILYVTHNLGVVAQVCDRVAVMYASELVEDAATQELFSKPLHPYTQGLIDSIPRMGDTKDNIQLRAITGQIPPIGEAPSGCVFRTRCPVAVDICMTRPPLFPAGESRYSRCHRWSDIDQGEISAHQPTPAAIPEPIKPNSAQHPDLKVKELTVHFPLQRSISDWASNRPSSEVRAVNGISFELTPGHTLGLVGESGSGKTTIARTIMGLEGKSSGSIELLEIPLPDKLSRRDLDTLRLLQMVFQNPEEALNPHHTIAETLHRPLVRLSGLSDNEANSRVAELLQAVRLPATYAERLPGQLSGGEIQRVAIARALASNPELIILDEPVSSLDVSVQATILNLVGELQADLGTSLMFISHDLAIVGYLADQIGVIYLGSLMEISGPDDLFQPPHHPYTEALLSAIPLADPSRKGEPIHLGGEIPNPVDLPNGCPFHTRCPRYLGEICATQAPPWQVAEETGKQIFCHIPLAELSASQEDMLAERSKLSN